MTPLLFEFQSFSTDDTAELAARIGQALTAPCVLCLEGSVGAGKTHFARSLIQSLQDHPEDVPSPTFTLIQTYESSKGEIWHADLYRLTTPDEVEELGLTEAFETAICLVEWPDRLAELIPQDALTLRFTTGQNEGHRQIQAFSDEVEKWQAILPRVTNA